MRRAILAISLGLGCGALCPAIAAETVIAAGTIRSQSLIMPSDIAVVEGSTPGALADPAQAIGMEAAVNLYAGRPIRPGDLRAPAIIEDTASAPCPTGVVGARVTESSDSRNISEGN
jgi:flagella basal body P-ring formation protein FlgA